MVTDELVCTCSGYTDSPCFYCILTSAFTDRPGDRVFTPIPGLGPFTIASPGLF